MGLSKLTLFATLARYVIIGVDPGTLPSAPVVVTTSYASAQDHETLTNTLTNVQAGDMILVYHNAWDYTKPILSISDTNSNTYTSQFPTTELDATTHDMPCAVWMAIANSSNASLVITSGQNNYYQVMTSVLVRGFDSSSKFDDGGGAHPFIYGAVGTNTLNVLTPETTSSHNLQLTGWMWYYSACVMRFDPYSTPITGVNDGGNANRVYVLSITLTSQGKYYPTAARLSGPGGTAVGFTLTIRGLNGLTPVTPPAYHTELNNFTISSNMSLSAYSAAWSGYIQYFEVNSGGLRIVPGQEINVGEIIWTSDLSTATNQRITINYSDSANAEQIYLKMCVSGGNSYLLQLNSSSILVKKNDVGIGNTWDANSWNPSFSTFPQLTVNSASSPTTAILEIINGRLTANINGIELYSIIDSTPLSTGTVSLFVVKETTKINSIKLEKWEP